MVLPMPRPPKTGVYYFRQKTPVDLLAVFERKDVRWSIGTNDPEETQVRNIEAVCKPGFPWAALRKRPVSCAISRLLAVWHPARFRGGFTQHRIRGRTPVHAEVGQFSSLKPGVSAIT
ncbi:DUF6538 domain-containing protein [Pseudotabrizicola formosa]|uniref:DUF6538 domain-containing protein n=1 Tax=Pseudotabrizicola formosa TaxID=2030009 RepID=UPI000CD11D1A|nr:DUF6538 domain-containing protein [Pseudotabrizicola formosa]